MGKSFLAAGIAAKQSENHHRHLATPARVSGRFARAGEKGRPESLRVRSQSRGKPGLSDSLHRWAVYSRTRETPPRGGVLGVPVGKDY
jgi:hypothetical protein